MVFLNNRRLLLGGVVRERNLHRGELRATRSACLRRLRRITNTCQQQLERCQLFTEGARRLLDTDVNKLKKLHAHQCNLGLKERGTELLATPRRRSWWDRCTQRRVTHDLSPTSG
jgi:hypothetical protein